MIYMGGKHNRILEIYDKLLNGEGINTKEAAEAYGVSTKTINRDIDNIRCFLSDKIIDGKAERDVIYDRSGKTYKMTGSEILSAQEV